MANKTCPVCGLEQAEAATECGRCGWDFSPMLGTAEQTRAFLAKRLEEARAAWRQRRYNPELVPELERDPFETPEEFAARLAERPWYVGEAELQKGGYDIKTGRFPLRLKSVTTWAEPWVSTADSCHLELPREHARALYQEGVVWPVYARPGVRSGQLSLDALMVPTSDGEIPLVHIPLTRIQHALKTVPLVDANNSVDRPSSTTYQAVENAIARVVRPHDASAGNVPTSGPGLAIKSISWCRIWRVANFSQFAIISSLGIFSSLGDKWHWFIVPKPLLVVLIDLPFDMRKPLHQVIAYLV